MKSYMNDAIIFARRDNVLSGGRVFLCSPVTDRHCLLERRALIGFTDTHELPETHLSCLTCSDGTFDVVTFVRVIHS